MAAACGVPAPSAPKIVPDVPSAAIALTAAGSTCDNKAESAVSTAARHTKGSRLSVPCASMRDSDLATVSKPASIARTRAPDVPTSMPMASPVVMACTPCADHFGGTAKPLSRFVRRVASRCYVSTWAYRRLSGQEPPYFLGASLGCIGHRLQRCTGNMGGEGHIRQLQHLPIRRHG